MKFYVDRIEVKIYADQGYIAQEAKKQIYNEIAFVVVVPDDLVVVHSDDRAEITPEILAFAKADVEDRTGWEIISCKVTQ